MNRQRAIGLVYLVVVIICVYKIGLAIYAINTVGTVQLSSSDPKAVLSISQTNHQAAALGVGTAKARIKPGSYQVSAYDNGYQSTATISVTSKKTTQATLELPAAAQSSSSSHLFESLPSLGPHSEYEIVVTNKVVGNTSGPVIIIASPVSAGQQAAKNWLAGQGVSLSDYLVQYQTVSIQDYPYTGAL